MNEAKPSSADDLSGSSKKFFENYRSANTFIFDVTKRFTVGSKTCENTVLPEQGKDKETVAPQDQENLNNNLSPVHPSANSNGMRNKIRPSGISLSPQNFLVAIPQSKCASNRRTRKIPLTVCTSKEITSPHSICTRLIRTISDAASQALN